MDLTTIIIVLIIITILIHLNNQQNFTPNPTQINEVKENIHLFKDPNYAKTKQKLPWIDVVSYEKFRMSIGDADITDQHIRNNM